MTQWLLWALEPARKFIRSTYLAGMPHLCFFGEVRFRVFGWKTWRVVTEVDSTHAGAARLRRGCGCGFQRRKRCRG